MNKYTKNNKQLVNILDNELNNFKENSSKEVRKQFYDICFNHLDPYYVKPFTSDRNINYPYDDKIFMVKNDDSLELHSETILNGKKIYKLDKYIDFTGKGKVSEFNNTLKSNFLTHSIIDDIRGLKSDFETDKLANINGLVYTNAYSHKFYSYVDNLTDGMINNSDKKIDHFDIQEGLTSDICIITALDKNGEEITKLGFNRLDFSIVGQKKSK